MSNKENLWITDGEVVDISNKITGRSKKVDRDYHNHGESLLKGLEKIDEMINNPSDSLVDEDLVVFEVEINEIDKLSNSQRVDDLTKDGLTINYVQPNNKAIVSSNKRQFKKLKNKVSTYYHKGKNKKFNYIESFGPVEKTSKKTSTLKEMTSEDDGVLQDVQIMVIPRIDEFTRDRVIQRLNNKIVHKSSLEKYILSDGTGIIRAELSNNEIESLSEDSAVCMIDVNQHYKILTSSVESEEFEPECIDTTDYLNLPIVVVLDDGISLPSKYDKLVLEHWSAGVANPLCDHGTLVASKVMFGNIGYQNLKKLKPRARVIDCPIIKDESTENKLIKYIQSAVEKYNGISKIFNISINAKVPINGDSISIFGYELDNLSLKYDVKFVISSGNHYVYKTTNDINKIIDDSDSRISSPADSMLNISVGAVCGNDFIGYPVKKDMITLYSRIGPGIQGFVKPDLVAYGGVTTRKGEFEDAYSMLINKKGIICHSSGTSFTAPQIAGDLAEIYRGVNYGDLLLSQALLYHNARKINTGNSYKKDDFYLFGRGIPDVNASNASSNSKVSFLRCGTINRLTKQRIKFYLPSNLSAPSFKGKVKVTTTCVLNSPVDQSKGPDYLGAYVSLSIHNINSKGKMNGSKKTDSDYTTKWENVAYRERVFSSFSPGNWEIWLELFSRWGVEHEDNIRYALVVTIEELSHRTNIYDMVISEAKNRFKPISEVFVKNRVKNHGINKV